MPISPEVMQALPLRERQRRARCERILSAAEALVREGASTDFSMVTLAERAEMSQTTPYNLFGSKAGILYALLNRSMGASSARQFILAGADPVESILRAAEIAADLLAADPQLYRPLWRFLLGVRDRVHRPAVLDRALGWWKVAMESAQAAGLLADVVDGDELARELVIHTMGVLDLWVQGELTDEQFRAQLAYGTGLKLLAVADEASRPRILEHMRHAKAALPRSFRFSGAATPTQTARGGSEQNARSG